MMLGSLTRPFRPQGFFFFPCSFSLCRFVVTYILGLWKYSQMRDARYRRYLNPNIYCMRDITACFMQTLDTKKSILVLSNDHTHIKSKHICFAIPNEWDLFQSFALFFFSFSRTVTSWLKWKKRFLNEGPALLARVGDQYRPKGLCRACMDSIIRISIRAVVILS